MANAHPSNGNVVPKAASVQWRGAYQRANRYCRRPNAMPSFQLKDTGDGASAPYGQYTRLPCKRTARVSGKSSITLLLQYSRTFSSSKLTRRIAIEPPQARFQIPHRGRATIDAFAKQTNALDHRVSSGTIQR